MRPSTLTPGTPVGPYEIVALLGAGGMGKVYRGRDTRLKRDIAIKVLSEELSEDPDRLVRFQREAELLATLNHPHIAAIYGLERANSTQALVLELVEGPTLAERIAEGPMPVEEALAIAAQIADALEAAHGQGIVHRDLKPANIKVRPDGTVKVLDFGLAKALPSQPSTLSNSPTQFGMTQPGFILGTAAYMSPEQATGKEADRSDDVWAFGCVLYEMLSGRAAFEGETAAEIIAGILKDEPDWRRLPPGLPVNIQRLIRHCLAKARRDRLKHIGDARIEIRDTPVAVQEGTPPVFTRRHHWLSAAALALAASTIVLLALLASRPNRPAPEMRLEISAPPTPDATSLAISPDGQTIAFLASADGQTRLWLRRLDSPAMRPLAGTDGGFYPFWAPDNQSIGFFAEGKLKRIDINSGLVRELANAPNPFGGTWTRTGTILFNPNATGPIFRVAAAGGEPVAVTKVGPQQTSHGFPIVLPDDERFLYYVRGTAEQHGVWAAQIDGTAPRRVLEADSPAVLASGRLLFARRSILLAQDFNPTRLTVSGSPSPLGVQIAVNGDSDLAALSASLDGPIVYRAGSADVKRQFTWFDRSGRRLGTVGEVDSAAPQAPSLSPDGTRVALYRTVDGNLDVWILDLGSGALSRFSFDASAEAGPIWSPDGRRIIFNSNRNGVFDLYEKAFNGPGVERLVLATSQNKQPVDWSRDGRYVLYRTPGDTTGFDLWTLPMVGDHKPFPVVQTAFEERDGQFSPDGKWVAYQSNESGRVEIYVRTFPDPGPGRQVSSNGGAQVRWRLDGRELFYIDLSGRLMAVPIRGGATLETGTPTPLFNTQLGGALQGTIRQQYMVSPDGQRFLLNTVQETTLPISVLVNWHSTP